MLVKDGDIMKLKIIKYDGETTVYECDSFEFRKNQVSEWIQIKSGDKCELIKHVAVIKSIADDSN